MSDTTPANCTPTTPASTLATLTTSPTATATNPATDDTDNVASYAAVAAGAVATAPPNPRSAATSVSTQITPRRSYIKSKLAPRLRRLANDNRKKPSKPHNRPTNQRVAVDDSILPVNDEPLLDSSEFYRLQQHERVPVCPPPPVRNWGVGQYQDIPNAPIPCHSTMNVTVRSPFVPRDPASATAPQSQEGACAVSDDDGFQTVRAKRQKKREQTRACGKPLKGAEKKKPIFLFITQCDPDSTQADIEAHFIATFEDVTEVQARKTTMTHEDYSSFTVVVKGKDLSLELLCDPDYWPANIRVYGREPGGRRRF